MAAAHGNFMARARAQNVEIVQFVTLVTHYIYKVSNSCAGMGSP